MGKKGAETMNEFPLKHKDLAIVVAVALGFSFSLFCIYLTLPPSDYSFLKLPRNLEDLKILRDHLEGYTSDYTAQVLAWYCFVYIFMETFMIPGTVFMSLLAGALFGVLKGLALVVFAATAGASSCYFLSKMVRWPVVFSLWPSKVKFFQDQVSKRRNGLLNYMLFLRLTPTLPNTFINFASPIVDVPYSIFFIATFFGLIPAAYVTVRVKKTSSRLHNLLRERLSVTWPEAGLALGDLKSVGDLYDFTSLFMIGVLSITPTLMGSSR